MKFQVKSIILLFLSFFSLSVYSQTVLESAITNVKVFRQNAEITRESSTKLYAGTQEIVITDISTFINPSSLQVKLASTGKVTLLSAKYQKNYLLERKNKPEIEKLKINLDKINADLTWIKDQKETYVGMENILNVNKDLGSKDAGFTPNQVAELLTVYKTKLFEIRKELSLLKKEETDIIKRRNKIKNQLKELNAKFNKPSGNLVLLVSSISPTTVDFKCSYIVNNAGWNPVYDLRSESISKDVQLNYKANVYQKTGQEWENINLVISTGNPTKNNDRPILTPLYANIYTAVYNDKYYGKRENKKQLALLLI